MIKLITVKNKAKAATSEDSSNQNQLSAYELRLQKDFAELDLPQGCTINFPEGPEKQLHFEITICPTDNIYRGGKFLFDFTIGSAYPYEAPKVLCKTKVFHPNIDLEGKICLNYLREEWNPVLTVKHIVLGLQQLFMSPKPENPLNKEAGQMLADQPKTFEDDVQRSIVYGATIQNQYFPSCSAAK